MLVWEDQGYSIHREAGLPDARQAVLEAFRSGVSQPSADAAGLSEAVLRLSVERFAWGGYSSFGADVALDDLADDAALDAVAEYLWASRHDAPPQAPRPGA